MFYLETILKKEETIKKSRFIGIILPCQTVMEANQLLEEFRQEYANASHVVFAYRIENNKEILNRYSDNGEPGGTAGKPVYQQIEGHQLINTLCIVIRYYGGIKLGTGGLVRAYAHAAKSVIQASELKPYIKLHREHCTIPYHRLNEFEYKLKQFDGRIINQTFTDEINLVIEIPEKQSKAFFQSTGLSD